MKNNLKSYPQFKILYQNIYNKDTFTFTIPFLGTSDEENEEVSSKEIKDKAKDSSILEAQKMIALMNSELSGGK